MLNKFISKTLIPISVYCKSNHVQFRHFNKFQFSIITETQAKNNYQFTNKIESMKKFNERKGENEDTTNLNYFISSKKTIEILRKKGITSLMPIQT